MGHGGGLIPLAAVQTRGQRELAVRHSRLQTATPEPHRDTADVKIQVEKSDFIYFFPDTNTAIKTAT